MEPSKEFILAEKRKELKKIGDQIDAIEGKRVRYNHKRYLDLINQYCKVFHSIQKMESEREKGNS